MKLSSVCGIVLALSIAAPLGAYEGWITDLAAGKARAEKEKKTLVVEFTGSSWCPPCKALHAKVLTSAEFKDWSRDKVLVKLDYPTSRERTPEKVAANPQLAELMRLKEQYGVPGFPTVFVFNPAGKELAKVVGYSGEDAATYLKKLGVP